MTLSRGNRELECLHALRVGRLFDVFNRIDGDKKTH